MLGHFFAFTFSHAPPYLCWVARPPHHTTYMSITTSVTQPPPPGFGWFTAVLPSVAWSWETTPPPESTLSLLTQPRGDEYVLGRLKEKKTRSRILAEGFIGRASLWRGRSAGITSRWQSRLMKYIHLFFFPRRWKRDDKDWTSWESTSDFFFFLVISLCYKEIYSILFSWSFTSYSYFLD